MQSVVVAQPYEFIPPRYSGFWHRLIRWILPRTLRKTYGISAVGCIGAEKLQASLAAGHGVMVVSNHCRPCDPMVLDSLAAEVRRPFHVIASWHVFMLSRLQRFLLPRVGGFSVYREGMDRESLKCAVNLVAEGKHPLVIFPEGIITRSNDRLASFMEGTAFMARAAAKQRKERGKVVVHPVFIRYFFEGNLEKTVLPVVAEIERRLSWQPQTQLPLAGRIRKVGGALLGLKEIEYFGETRQGTIRERLQGMEDRLLSPLEVHWTGGRHDGGTMARVKRLRTAILPEMVTGNLGDAEKAERWRYLADLYLVQQLHGYPDDYFDEPSPERILETVERYEEDLTDKARAHFPIRAVIMVGDAIEVGTERDRLQESDPVTAAVRESMEAMLEASKAFRREPPTGTELA
jgi:1-acyl-sn-glycerol-3-phosphate acyltransferase